VFILGLKDRDIMKGKLHFCSRFITTCDPADLPQITQMLACLSGMSPPKDARLLGGRAIHLQWLFCSPTHAMAYLAAMDLFRRVYLLREEAVDSSAVRWCLRLINFHTNVRDHDIATVRELFPIEPLLILCELMNFTFYISTVCRRKSTS
jgi:hypothetical protein